jgi:tRNA-specific adenosine deaminase 1
MTPDPDAVADCVLATFHRLPDKRKPRPRRDASAEWVPLTGIVLSTSNDGTLVCVSLGSVSIGSSVD